MPRYAYATGRNTQDYLERRTYDADASPGIVRVQRVYINDMNLRVAHEYIDRCMHELPAVYAALPMDQRNVLALVLAGLRGLDPRHRGAVVEYTEPLDPPMQVAPSVTTTLRQCDTVAALAINADGVLHVATSAGRMYRREARHYLDTGAISYGWVDLEGGLVPGCAP